MMIWAESLPRAIGLQYTSQLEILTAPSQSRQAMPKTEKAVGPEAKTGLWAKMDTWAETDRPGRFIATLQLWVGIQPISSSHDPYPTYMHSPLCLPLATLH